MYGSIMNIENTMKKRKCKFCKEQFTPVRMVQPFCLKDECVKQWVESVKQKQWVKRKNQIKDELSSANDYLKIAQRLVNKYVRNRDGKFCISCNKSVNGKVDAGHFFSVGNYPSVRFDLRNISSQCIRCNQYNGGSLPEYRKYLIEKIGQEEFEELESIARNPKTYTIEELKEIIKEFKILLKNQFIV